MPPEVARAVWIEVEAARVNGAFSGAVVVGDRRTAQAVNEAMAIADGYKAQRDFAKRAA